MKDSSNKRLKNNVFRSATAVRPQIPQDKYGMGEQYHQGEGMPPGGFRAMFSWRKGADDTKNSRTTKPGKTVY